MKTIEPMHDVKVNLPWRLIKLIAVKAYISGLSFNELCEEALNIAIRARGNK
jgi:hypothetical protein